MPTREDAGDASPSRERKNAFAFLVGGVSSFLFDLLGQLEDFDVALQALQFTGRWTPHRVCELRPCFCALRLDFSRERCNIFNGLQRAFGVDDDWGKGFRLNLADHRRQCFLLSRFRQIVFFFWAKARQKKSECILGSRTDTHVVTPVKEAPPLQGDALKG